MALGKFQGVTKPTTPMGLRMANICTRSRSEGTRRPLRRDPSPREIAEDVDGAPDFAFGFRQRLAFLARHFGRDLVEAAIQDLGRLKKNCAARRGIHCRPGGESGGGRRGGIRDIAGCAFGELADDFGGVGGVAILEVGFALDPLAVDVIGEDRECPCNGQIAGVWK